MTRQIALRLAVDGGMIVLMMLLMAFERVGRTAHEWLGLALFVLFIAHHLLNRRRLQGLLRAPKRATNTLSLGVTLLLALCMIGTMASAVLISRTVFAFLPVGGALGVGRRLHMLTVNACFLSAGLHLGLHGQMMLGIVRQRFPHLSGRVFCALGLVVTCCGFVAFCQSGMIDDLLLRNEFAFVDYSQPLALFLVDRLAIFGFFAWLGHRLMRLCVRR